MTSSQRPPALRRSRRSDRGLCVSAGPRVGSRSSSLGRESDQNACAFLRRNARHLVRDRFHLESKAARVFLSLPLAGSRDGNRDPPRMTSAVDHAKLLDVCASIACAVTVVDSTRRHRRREAPTELRRFATGDRDATPGARIAKPILPTAIRDEAHRVDRLSRRPRRHRMFSPANPARRASSRFLRRRSPVGKPALAFIPARERAFAGSIITRRANAAW